MQAENIQYSNLDEIVFEKRNKGYGAYVLRKTYDKHVNTAVAIAIALFLLFISLPAIIEFIKGQEVVVKTPPKKVKYTDLAQPPPMDKTIPPPPQVDIPPPVKTVIKYLPPEVTEEQVREEEEMATIEDVKTNETGSENVEGEPQVEFNVAPATEVIAEEAPVEQLYTIVEQMPEFPGGTEELMKYLGKKTKYPPLAIRMGVEGSVYVQFVVTKEGSIDAVQVVKGLSKECDEEAMRVIKSMPNWKAGKQNGRAVAVKYVLPIKFKMEG